jgi:hypothetical protein
VSAQQELAENQIEGRKMAFFSDNGNKTAIPESEVVLRPAARLIKDPL